MSHLVNIVEEVFSIRLLYKHLLMKERMRNQFLQRQTSLHLHILYQRQTSFHLHIAEAA